MGHNRRSRHRARAWVCAALAVAWLGVAGAPARAVEYDPQEAGHPLRVIAYALHPIGVALDYLIFRPAYWLGSKEPLRTIFGVEDEFQDGGEAPPPQGHRHSPPPPPQGQKN